LLHSRCAVLIGQRGRGHECRGLIENQPDPERCAYCNRGIYVAFYCSFCGAEHTSLNRENVTADLKVAPHTVGGLEVVTNMQVTASQKPRLRAAYARKRRAERKDRP
jgi:hypothetical protein